MMAYVTAFCWCILLCKGNVHRGIDRVAGIVSFIPRHHFPDRVRGSVDGTIRFVQLARHERERHPGVGGNTTTRTSTFAFVPRLRPSPSLTVSLVLVSVSR